MGGGGWGDRPVGGGGGGIDQWGVGGGGIECSLWLLEIGYLICS